MWTCRLGWFREGGMTLEKMTSTKLLSTFEYLSVNNDEYLEYLSL